MPKTSWNDVTSAVTNRRNAGRNTGQNTAPKGPGALASIASMAGMGMLQPIVNQIAGKEKTFCLAVVVSNAGTDLISCFKGGGVDAMRNAIERTRQTYLPSGRTHAISSPGSGMHAEMAIVRYCVQQLGISKADLQYKLQILCVGKLVCVDCAGWLNQHYIGHLSLVKEGAAVQIHREAGPASKSGGGLWRHPLTESVYSGGKEVNYYRSEKRKVSLQG